MKNLLTKTFTISFKASCNYVEGLNTCLNILSQLGEYIPAEVNADIYVNEVTQVKELLHGKTRQELLSLPKMTDTNALAAMQFLSHALTMSYASSPMLNPILVFRMVKMTILHGICNISSFAFGCYGAWLVSEPTCDIEGGHRMGRMAIEMMKRLGAIEMMPRLYVPVYGFTNIWKGKRKMFGMIDHMILVLPCHYLFANKCKLFHQ